MDEPLDAGHGDPARLVLFLVFLGLALRYWHWRILYTYTDDAPVLFFAFLGTEAVAALATTSCALLALWPIRRQPGPSRRTWSVDIFVTTIDEDVRLLRDTLLATVGIRHPHTTYVLDDGGRDEVRILAEELGLCYLARGDRSHAKAGNLNHGLLNSTGELILVLDADHVPAPEIVDRIVGFFEDDRLAIVQLSQDFYNLDSFQHFTNWRRRRSSQAQEVFFSFIQPGRDRCGAAIYCGSPALVRRTAVQEIGGFAVQTVTEDIHTGLRLQKAGWRVIYVNRSLARGLAPQTFTAFAVQWDRWARGFAQMFRAERILGDRALSLAQRLCYLDSVLFYCLSGPTRLLLILLPSLSLLTGWFPVWAEPADFVRYFLPYFVCGLTLTASLQGGLLALVRNERLSVLRAMILARATFPLTRRALTFSVTPKSGSAAANWRRLRLHCVLVGVSLLAFLVGGLRMALADSGGVRFAFAVMLVWQWLNIDLLMTGIDRALSYRERRALYRFRSQLEVSAWIEGGRTGGGPPITTVEVADLNRLGAGLWVDRPLVPGETVRLHLGFADGTVTCAARAVWQRAPGAGGRSLCGVVFDEGDSRCTDTISRHLLSRVVSLNAPMLRVTDACQRDNPST